MLPCVNEYRTFDVNFYLNKNQLPIKKFQTTFKKNDFVL